jgi:hypothetical protein
MAKKKAANPTKATGLIRGVSQTEYRSLLALVKSGKTTWKKLEEKGICKPARRRNSEYVDAVMRKLGEK